MPLVRHLIIMFFSMHEHMMSTLYLFLCMQ